MSYVDGFVIPIPKKNVKMYKKMAEIGRKVWLEHGALEYFECIGDDMKPMPGCLSFPQIAKARPGETVFFSFIVYRNRKHRDQVNAKVMKDPRMKMDSKAKMPFNPKRMAYGGFEGLVVG